MSKHCVAVAVAALLLLHPLARAEPVGVRYTEGIVHGFLSLRTMDGTLVANGDRYEIVQFVGGG